MIVDQVRAARISTLAVATVVLLQIGTACASRSASADHSPGRASGFSSASSSSSASAKPADSSGPAGTDPQSDNGSFAPLPPGTDTSGFMSAESVQKVLEMDGASADWVKPSTTLRIEVGQYIPETVPQTLGTVAPTPRPGEPLPAFRFTGNTAPCPASPGGAVADDSSTSAANIDTCGGTVMADARTGEILFVQTYGIG